VTVGEARAALAARLGRAGVPTPDVDAAWLLRHVLGWSGSRLATGAGDEHAGADLQVQAAEADAADEQLQWLPRGCGPAVAC
jgi:hypothetical protein